MGGTERQVVTLAKGLLSRGHDVSVLSRWPVHDDNPYRAELRDADVRFVASGRRGSGTPLSRGLPYLRSRLGVRGRRSDDETETRLWRWQARALLALGGPDVVVHEVPFFGVISPAGRAVLRELRLPTVHTVLGQMTGVLPVPATPWAVLTADGTPQIAGDPAYRWIPSMAESTGRVAVERSPGSVLYAGRLVEQKGLEHAVSAVAQLGPGWRLLIAGYGPQEAVLRARAAELGVDVDFLGVVSPGDMTTLYAQADVLVQPSLHGEGLPSSVVESLAAGTPVVASAVGGLTRLASTASDAPVVLVPPGDPAALAAGLRAAAGPVRRAAARRFYEEQLAADVVLPQYEACYAEAVESAPIASR
ncbi:MAG: hypothetical protein QOI82_1577 [Actinomycetota bacterium]|jgi:glycosyltransferase involved in cell wall biosynthesis|nr:hypothetical protein [Actinomycetota bacterium]